MELTEEAGREHIDEAMEAWRQGDCVLGEHWFLFRLDVESPLTDEAAAAAEQGADAAEAEVRGLMLATQTCDIVRRCVERPFVQVCPLVEVEAGKLKEVRRARRPNLAYVAGVADRNLVADLDRVMTVEKAVVAGWQRVAGCLTHAEERRLALALARKRARVAYPDDFVELASSLLRRLSSKHDKNSGEGRALRSLREIRVRAAPSWAANEVMLTFHFVRNEGEPEFEGQGWEYYLGAWLNRVPARGRFVSVDGLVQTLDDLSARVYVESDPLDLDYLSSRDDG